MEEKIFDRIFAVANLYAESAPGTTLVELIGNHRVLIENHRGVTAYGCNEICVSGSDGNLCVRGKKLELMRMSSQQLVISGHIDCVLLS